MTFEDGKIYGLLLAASETWGESQNPWMFKRLVEMAGVKSSADLEEKMSRMYMTEYDVENLRKGWEYDA